MKNIIKDNTVVILVVLTLVFLTVSGIVLGLLQSNSILELPAEQLVINEDGTLTGIKDTPQKKYRITLPDSVKEIGNNAFEGDDLLVDITFNIGLQRIHAYAFSNCVNLQKTNLADIDFLKTIGGYAFSGCTSLESIIFPYEMPLMGDYAFEGCVSLIDLEFSSKLSGLCTGLFLNCTGLQTVRFSESETEIPIGIFEGCSSLKNVYLPETLKIINHDAFKNCVSLESIELPKNLKIISWEAFDGCTSLKSIDIPDSVTCVYEAFNGCPLLSETENGITYVDGWAVSIAEETENVIFREGTVGIARGMKCPNVKTVYIPSSVKCFADTFRNSQTLTEVVFADNCPLESLYSYAFLDCTALEKVDFGKNSSLTSLGWMGFKGCTALKSIVIPASVVNIGNSFEDCTALEKIEYEENN